MADTYRYCDDNGHVLIPESAEEDPTGEGLQCCECCAGWFYVDDEGYVCSDGGDHDWDADLQACQMCGLDYANWHEPLVVDITNGDITEGRCCA